MHNAAMIRLFQIGALLALCWLAIGASSARAEVCDVEEVLERLQADALGPLPEEEQVRARKVLTGFCGGIISETPRRVVSTDDPAQEQPAPEPGGAPDAEESDRSLKVLGVEIQRAEEDSRGHERLKKKR